MKSKTPKVIRPVRLPKPLRSLPIKERRKIIAKDILARFEHGQLIPQELVYVSLSSNGGVETNDLQTLLVQPSTECHVCAIGAAICSTAGFEDKIKLCGDNVVYRCDGYSRDGVVYGQINSLLGKAFLRYIEACFEGYPDVNGGKTITFNDMFPDVTKRFVAIWGQVAKHGDFKVERVPGFKEAHED